MPVTREDIKNLADLARLQLSDDDVVTAERELDSILEYVDRLQAVDTSGVVEHSMPAKIEGWRKDEALSCDELTRELVLGNFPRRVNNLLHVPPVFEKPKG